MLKTDDQYLLLTNQHKTFWLSENYTKGDLCAYYKGIAPSGVDHAE